MSCSLRFPNVHETHRAEKEIAKFRACELGPNDDVYSLGPCCQLHSDLGQNFLGLFRIMLHNQQSPFRYKFKEFGGMRDIIRGMGLRFQETITTDARILYQVSIYYYNP